MKVLSVLQAISIALLVVLAAPASGAMPAAAGSQRSYIGVECTDVLVVGARGSGEKADSHVGVGTTVALAASRFRRSLTAQGRTMTLMPLTEYPARSVDSIVWGQIWDGNGMKRYLDGVNTGVQEAKDKIASRGRQCPDERIVLMGYSQGAMVAHRTWQALPAKTRSRVAAIVLVADPDRMIDTQARLIGSPTAPSSSEGIASYVFEPDKPDVPDTPFPGTRVWQVCTERDIVCDTREETLLHPRLGVRLHTSYADDEAQRNLLAAVARQAALATAVCPAACSLRGAYEFTHPTWGDSRLLLVGERYDSEYGDDVFFNSQIVLVDAEGRIQWVNPMDAMYEFEFANPTMDASGNLFINYNPGRLNGVIILRPQEQGFEDFETLDGTGSYRTRFYGADLDGPGPDGLYAVRKEENDCDPTCTGGTTWYSWYDWDGSDYVLRE